VKHVIERDDTLMARFLEEGKQRPAEVAGWLREFLEEARESLDLAFYDVHLSSEPAVLLRDTLARLQASGVRVRLAYDDGDKPQTPRGVDQTGVGLITGNTHQRVEEFDLPPEIVRAVSGPNQLMHHKYVVRDGALVWTGSLNLSDDSMSRMENIIVVAASRPLAAAFRRDFDRLWDTGQVETSRAFVTESVPLQAYGEPAETTISFSPGQGRELNDEIAERVGRAQRRIVFCSMLVTSSRILRALVSQVDRAAIEVTGVYDRTQMAGVLDQWRERQDLWWKIEAFERLTEGDRLVGKDSEPFRPGHSHNFMHNKTLVVDDTVITGSYNLSHAAQTNAENVLMIESVALAGEVARYTDGLKRRFLTPLPPSAIDKKSTAR